MLGLVICTILGGFFVGGAVYLYMSAKAAKETDHLNSQIWSLHNVIDNNRERLERDVVRMKRQEEEISTLKDACEFAESAIKRVYAERDEIATKRARLRKSSWSSFDALAYAIHGPNTRALVTGEDGDTRISHPWIRATVAAADHQRQGYRNLMAVLVPMLPGLKALGASRSHFLPMIGQDLLSTLVGVVEHNDTRKNEISEELRKVLDAATRD